MSRKVSNGNDPMALCCAPRGSYTTVGAKDAKRQDRVLFVFGTRLRNLGVFGSPYVVVLACVVSVGIQT